MKFLILLFLSTLYLATSIYGDVTNSPTISITSTASISEGDSGTAQLTLNITTSECPNKKDISVHWFTASNTAIEDDDFTKDDGDIVFSASSCTSSTKTKEISIDIIGDTTHEADELFNINIQISANSAQNYTEGVLVSTLTITNDDEEPANTPPTIDTIPEQSAYNDTNYSLDISNYTTDRDNDPILSYTLTGTIPNGLSFNSTSGLLSGVADENITSNLSVYATDTDGNSNIILFDIVVSDAPEEIEPVNNADDLCYDTVTTDGFCAGIMNFMCTITTPIKNKNSDTLTDVQVILASTNMFSAFSDCGVDGVSGDCNDSSQMSMMSMSALNDGINYSMPNYTALDSHTTYTSAMFSFLSTSYEYLAKYTKNGTTYQGVINPCGTVVEEDPIFEACGIFPSALNTWDTIYAENNDEVIYADAVNANNGVDGVVGCSDHPLAPSEQSSPCSVGTLDMDPPGLPNFINSTESSAYTATTTLTNSQYGDLTVSSGDTVTFSSDTTYTDNSRKIMLIKSLTIHENTTLTFDAGDYYIGEWSSDKSLTLRTNGLVRFFINGDMLLSDNFLDFNYDSDTGTPADMFIFVGGNFAMTSSGGGSGYNMVAFVFTNGTFNAGTNTNNSSFRGAITAVGSISLNNNQTYTYDTDGLDDNGFGDCDSATHTPTLGRFDAWQTSILDREITTKIVDKSFNLILASLTDDFTTTLDRDGITIKYKLYDYDSNLTITNGWDSWDITAGNPTTEKSFSDILKAYKDVRVRFKYCQEINTSDIVDYAKCYDEGHQYYEEVSSSDNFAIRPDRFELDLEHSHLPNLFLSGSEYNLSFNAHNYNSDINTANYNQSQSNINVNESVVVAKDSDGSAVMNGTTSWGDSTLFSISNGSMNEVGVAYIVFSDVGKLNLIVNDKEWASVDSDDTPQDCSTKGAFVCGDKDITFIPHHFGFKDTNITNHTISAGNFTYLSNLDNSNQSTYAMSARIVTTIIAQNESNGTTKNFQSGNSFYENPLDINATISDATHGDANTTSITNTLLGFTLGEKTITRDETNLSKVLRFNFPHQINNPINPFIIDATDLNLSTTSTYTQTPITGYDSSSNINGTENGLGDGNASFVYGRTHASRQTFEGANGVSNIYFEAYCYGNDCNKTILQNTTSPNLKYTNDIRWFINENHNASNDGDIGTVLQKYGAGISITTQNNNPSTATLTYNKNYGYPYKTTMQNSASSWLIYNEDDANAINNYFQVEFINIGAWTGESETDTTTKDIGSAKINRRTIW